MTPTNKSNGEMKPNNTKPNQLTTEQETIIAHTFNFLNHSSKKEGDNYCVHDIENNCFDTIEDIQGAVKKIVAQAIQTERERVVGEAILVINKMETWHWTNASPVIYREDLLRDIKALKENNEQ